MSKKSDLARRVMEITQNRANRRGGNRREPLINGSTEALHYLQYETSRELGLIDRIEEIGYENMTTKECGSIGGLMTKKMIAYAQQKMQEEIDNKGSLSDLPIFDSEPEDWNYTAHTQVHSRVNPEQRERFVSQDQVEYDYEDRQLH